MTNFDGRTDILKVLIGDPRLSVHALDRDGKTSISVAAVFGQCDALKSLLTDGRIDVHMYANNDTTALQDAASRGNLDFVKALIEFTANTKKKYKPQEISIAKKKAKGGSHSEVYDLLNSRFRKRRWCQ